MTFAHNPDPIWVDKRLIMAASAYGDNLDARLAEWKARGLHQEGATSHFARVCERMRSLRSSGEKGYSVPGRLSGWNHGYLAWRDQPDRLLVAMPTRCGFILEARHPRRTPRVWPVESIFAPDGNLVLDSYDNFTTLYYRTYYFIHLGLGAGEWLYDYLPNSVPGEAGHFVLVPYWAILTSVLLYPMFLITRAGRRRHRIRGGKCPECGYDLRATPNVCPECGTRTVVAAG